MDKENKIPKINVFAASTCPYCGWDDATIIDTYKTKNGAINRKRKCVLCGEKYKTVEMIVPR